MTNWPSVDMLWQVFRRPEVQLKLWRCLECFIDSGLWYETQVVMNLQQIQLCKLCCLGRQQSDKIPIQWLPQPAY